MWRFIKGLWNGEPIMFTGLMSVVLTTWNGAVVAAGDLPPLWLAIGAPVWVAIAAFYSRSQVTPA